MILILLRKLVDQEVGCFGDVLMVSRKALSYFGGKNGDLSIEFRIINI